MTRRERLSEAFWDVVVAYAPHFCFGVLVSFIALWVLLFIYAE